MFGRLLIHRMTAYIPRVTTVYRVSGMRTVLAYVYCTRKYIKYDIASEHAAGKWQYNLRI